jgi:hypothetical protein
VIGRDVVGPRGPEVRRLSLEGDGFERSVPARELRSPAARQSPFFRVAMVRAKPSLKTGNVDVKNPSGYSNVLDLGPLSVGSFWIIGGYQRCADGGGVGDQGKPVDGHCRDKRNCGVRSRSRGSTASGRYLSDQLIELEVAKRPWPDSGGWRFAPRKGMLGEDRVGGPVTTAEIEAVAEPLWVRRARSYRTVLGPRRFALQVIRAVVDGHDATAPIAGSHPG